MTEEKQCNLQYEKFYSDAIILEKSRCDRCIELQVEQNAILREIASNLQSISNPVIPKMPTIPMSLIAGASPESIGYINAEKQKDIESKNYGGI